MGKHYGLDIPTLHELRIDVDKEWVDEDGQPRGITKLKEVAAAMAQGGISFRGPSFLERLAANYGVGYSFLHAKNTGIDEPEWMDIQEIIAYITGGKNRMIAPPTLTIPVPPSISVVVAEGHSGGGHTATPTLTIPAPPTISLSELALFDQRYEVGADSDFSIYSNFWEAQTFTTLQAHNIEILEKLCRYVGSTATIGNITIGIRNTVADLPSGGDLTSVTFAASNLPASNIWLVKLITSQALAAATKYAMVIRASGGDGSNYMVWRADGTAPTYAGGARCHSDDGGGSWAEDTNTDMLFREGEVLV